jgi:hypothetical protein
MNHELQVTEWMPGQLALEGKCSCGLWRGVACYAQDLIHAHLRHAMASITMPAASKEKDMAKSNLNEVFKFLPQLLQWAPYIGVAISLQAEIREDLRDDGDSTAKKAADVAVDLLDAAGPLIIANNPKSAATFQQLFDNLRKTAQDFATTGA